MRGLAAAFRPPPELLARFWMRHPPQGPQEKMKSGSLISPLSNAAQHALAQHVPLIQHSPWKRSLRSGPPSAASRPRPCSARPPPAPRRRRPALASSQDLRRGAPTEGG